MDPTIQSLIQSPYMRAMASIPTKSEELVHGIADHLPPLVRTQVKVNPLNRPGPNGKWYFEIPRRGLWNRAVLHLRPKIVGGAGGAVRVNEPLINSNSLSYCHAVTNVELFSKQRFIERLIPEAIVSEQLRYKEKNYTWYIYDASDTTTTDIDFPLSNVALPFPYTAKDVKAVIENGSRPHFIIPLPLASFSSIKNNFQTLFVEPLTLVVSTKSFDVFTNVDPAGYDLELMCDYHSFHPNVETVIRNANYKQSIPATLPWHDWIEFHNQLSRGVSHITYSLESDALISTLIVIPQLQSNDFNMRHFACPLNMYFVITSASEILYEGSSKMTHLRTDLTLDETDANAFPDLMLDPNYSTYYAIRLGLRRDAERFTGGLALSSLVTPQITIYANEMAYRSAAGIYSAALLPAIPNYTFDVKVIAKRHFFMRIDSDTGVITRSIES